MEACTSVCTRLQRETQDDVLTVTLPPAHDALRHGMRIWAGRNRTLLFRQLGATTQAKLNTSTLPRISARNWSRTSMLV